MRFGWYFASYSIYFLGFLLEINSLIYFANFYSQIKKITLQTSLELLSYTSNQSRSRIYANKFLAYVILNILNLLIATIFLTITLVTLLSGMYFGQIIVVSLTYLGVALFLSLLFFGLFFLIDTFLVKKITKRHNVINLIIGLVLTASLISTPILLAYGPAAIREYAAKTASKHQFSVNLITNLYLIVIRMVIKIKLN
ncbi:hypothetical protein ACW95P_02160 [Candidatus Mycoplasma pogonae]